MNRGSIFTIFILIVGCFISGCTEKRDRLVANTSALRIDPTVVKVFNNSAQQVKALIRDSNNKDIEVEPFWSVSPSNLGVMGLPSTGKNGLFVAGATAMTGKLIASYDGLVGEVNVEILKEPYPLMSDNDSSDYLDRDALGNIILHYFDTDNAAPWQIDVNDLFPGSDADPRVCMKIDYTNSPGGWAGFYLQFVTSRDMSLYSKLTFYVKGDAGGEKFKIKLGDGSVIDKEVSVNSVTTTWSKVELPLEDFVDLLPTVLGKPFIIAFTDDYTGANATIYVDYIAFEK